MEIKKTGMEKQATGMETHKTSTELQATRMDGQATKIYMTHHEFNRAIAVVFKKKVNFNYKKILWYLKVYDR